MKYCPDIYQLNSIVNKIKLTFKIVVVIGKLGVKFGIMSLIHEYNALLLYQTFE